MAKILVVDDEPNINDMLEIRLKFHGYEVIKAFDGEEALKMARNEKPDLILLDIMLPKKNGYDICRLLKFDKKYQHIPIILFTARGSAQDIQNSCEVGADAFFNKPFISEELIAKIRELLKKKELEDNKL